MSDGTDVTLGPRFRAAIELANELHGNQTRKGKATPYLAHLLGVAALVLEDGGDEDQAIAGLLHDGPEDSGGLRTLAVIRSRFGDRVAAIVDACTDSYEEPKRPWLERKIAYLERLSDVPAEAVPVILADKLYNVRSILADHHAIGEDVWDRFKAEPQGVLWYYGQVVKTLAGRGGSLVHELDVAVQRLGPLAE